MAVHLTRIYTRTGDDGTTALGDMSRVAKTHARIAAFADVDEANAAVGVALALGNLPDEVAGVLRQVQNDLFDVGADLCTPVRERPDHPPLRVTETQIERLETACDRFNEALTPLASFVLPTPVGGNISRLGAVFMGPLLLCARPSALRSRLRDARSRAGRSWRAAPESSSRRRWAS